MAEITLKTTTGADAGTVELEAEPTPHVREPYARLRDRTDTWS